MCKAVRVDIFGGIDICMEAMAQAIDAICTIYLQTIDSADVPSIKPHLKGWQSLPVIRLLLAVLWQAQIRQTFLLNGN